MRKHKNLIFYSVLVGVSFILIYLLVRFGQINLEPVQVDSLGVDGQSSWVSFISNMLDNLFDPVSILLLQIIVILIAVRLFGWICQKIGQPTVVGEILAGVLLGPSLLGHYFPEIYDYVFPASSLGNINFLSQIGLILFMFIVGLELDIRTIKSKANDAIIISHSSIAVTFTFGVLLAYLLYDGFTYENTPFLPFALFMGIALSIAAFPVMARIIHERGINKTPLGSTIITTAAIDDITAWCLLAVVIAISKAGSFLSALYVILLSVVYILFMFKVVRPFLKRVASQQSSKRILSKAVIALFFVVLFFSSYATEVIGIHALFGAFIAGVIMPSSVNFRNLITEKIEDVTLVLLLPLFFVYTGLRTQIGLLNEPRLWAICGAIVLLAIVGKLFSSALAARFLGKSWKDSLIIGSLMNTRGLMQLVVLTIGFDLGFLTPEVFAMMVVVALATTFLTSPLLDLIEKIYSKKKSQKTAKEKKYRIVVSFDNTEMGRKLLFLANSFIRKRQSQSELTMIHLTEGHALYQYGMDEEEESIFKPVLDEASILNQNIVPSFEVVNDIPSSVAKIANKGEYNLLLVAARGSLFGSNLFSRALHHTNRIIRIPRFVLKRLKGYKRWRHAVGAPIDMATRTIITKTHIPIGIFIDKGMVGIRNIFVPILDEEDIFMGEFMERLAENSYVRITLWDAIGLSDNSIQFIQSIRAIKAVNPYLFQLWNKHIPIDGSILKKQDLMMISLDSWKRLDDTNTKWLKDIPSTLVLNK
ncbi:cation:proton antiporter [Dysgonomonas sp. 25]|uniref:cation:proton antiporter domain-containing protein n=1 Tax=Dysgonomonas sp. 25 TaxID=2302933 RepID=UPI0013D69968|nr:cation:proton antiporter [Dysgonomonas sp. 25]NDV67446.1 cation/H(+) antiporter [Dysgonomonas sp. 25]